MLEKVMQKGGQMIPKWSQTGSQNPSQIEKVMKKRHAKNDAETKGKGNPRPGPIKSISGGPPPAIHGIMFPQWGGPGGAYRQESHSLLTPVGSAD